VKITVRDDSWTVFLFGRKRGARQIRNIQELRITFLHGNLESLEGVEDGGFDLVVSSKSPSRAQSG